MAEGSPHESALVKVIVAASALSFGILGAIIGSMRDFVGGNAVFEFSFRTVVAFALGCLAGWLLWRGVRFLMRRANKTRQ